MTIRTRPATPEYREGWERTFGCHQMRDLLDRYAERTEQLRIAVAKADAEILGFEPEYHEIDLDKPCPPTQRTGDESRKIADPLPPDLKFEDEHRPTNPLVCTGAFWRQLGESLK